MRMNHAGRQEPQTVLILLLEQDAGLMLMVGGTRDEGRPVGVRNGRNSRTGLVFLGTVPSFLLASLLVVGSSRRTTRKVFFVREDLISAARGRRSIRRYQRGGGLWLVFLRLAVTSQRRRLLLLVVLRWGRRCRRPLKEECLGGRSHLVTRNIGCLGHGGCCDFGFWLLGFLRRRDCGGGRRVFTIRRRQRKLPPIFPLSRETEKEK